MSKATSDVVIVGGGAAGCAVAYYLTRAGVTVTIIERQGVGTQASGWSPGWDNVYLATGGAHKGILLSPAMGKAIADLITAGTTTLAIAPCAPERFTAVSA